ncbi:MAG TPA: bifunctional phosphoribosylaminoimidazolecarboxamide formyltransferase/IMP cyclohydrolase [Acidimicrobiales bacterium]|nr:bifunctional phosphoribosylaminoimidazolecarboxamide formyltransferase/IMP cyclohydrolase [Acidimicrobiales bacterium]
MRVLLSVYDKTGLDEFASGLVDLGWELVASGNTARALRDAGIAHTEVAELTGAPEMLGGRVKTLHPKIHGGILADRSQPQHMTELGDQGIDVIDLVVCNLYPFSSDPSIELIDVGGPTMVRAAAKNHAHVGVVVDPAEYGAVLAELRQAGSLSTDTRRRLARAAFAHTASYDAAIVGWFDGGGPGGEAALLPPTVHLALERAQDLRYGENPHQSGARYRALGQPTWWDGVVQRAGTALSYLNLFDADAAWRLVHELASPDECAVAIIKHANPCGAALAGDLGGAYSRALACDPLSAFGGVVALGGPGTAAVARLVAEGPQADVIVAPAWEDEAVDILVARRRVTRILEAPPYVAAPLQLRSLGGSYLVQDADRFETTRSQWQVATKQAPTAEQWRDIELAWRVCALTSSNAVVVAAAGQAVGIGAGQQSRVEASEIAVRKAGPRAVGAAAASDAFFPFRDGLDVLAGAGVAAVIQPGGSVRDAEMVTAADEHGMAMVLTGERHFRH